MDALMLLLAGLFVIVFVFALLRTVTLWYLRLDSIADNLDKIAKHTEYLATQVPPAGFPTLSAPSSPAPINPPAPQNPPAPRRFPLGGARP